MPGESLNFPIYAPDHASKNIREVGDAAAATAAKLDIAAASAKLWNDTARTSGKANDTLIASQLAVAKATRALGDAAVFTLGESRKMDQLLAGQADAFAKTGKAAEKAAGTGGATGLSALIGTAGGGAGAAGTGMTGAIAAGVALAPVIATLGVGLAGLGAAAYGIYKPISNAAQATGGLSANLAMLNPEQRIVAQGLLALGKQFGGFQQQLQPAVFGVFNQGLRLAGHLLGDVQPVAKATATAVGGLLSRIDAEFQSGTWQKFFGFMAANAGPDVKMLSDVFVNLTMALPPLLTALQPLAVELLKDSAGTAQLINQVAQLALGLEHLGTSTLHAGASSQRAGGFLGVLARAAKDAFGQLDPAIPGLAKIQEALHKLGDNAGPAARGIKGTGTAAQTAAAQVQAMATATTNLMTAQAAAVATQTAYGSAILTSANDAAALEKALDGTHGKIGLNTAAQRASFGAAQTYINDLAAQATQAVASGHGVDAAMRAIRNGLPILDSAKTKNKQYWQEVQTLVGWLDKLQLIKAIHETVVVTGQGSFHIVPGTKLGLPGGMVGGPFAAGGRVTGGIPGKDSVLVAAMPGEAFLSVPHTQMLAPLLAQIGVPGFAAGGLIPSYSGSVAGLVPWSRTDLNATVAIFEQAVAKATFAGMKAAAAAAASFGGAHGGPGGGAPSANAALAHRLYASQLTPASWAAWNFVALAESGWNQFARNPSSGAYGIAQALPPTKYPFAGQAAGGSNPMAQITWMWDYMRSRYGGPLGAAAHEAAFRWYDSGGWLYPGASLAVNTTGRPERVTSPAQETAMLAALGRIERLLQSNPDRTGAAVGGALHGTARGALYAGMYSPR